MVGLLSGMDNETSTVAPGDVTVVPDEAKPGESQPEAENADNVDEVEHVKELKSILKRRGQYTLRKVKVDFDLIPTRIPFDEDFYTTEIKIVEKEPVKIKSWAAIFAAKKAEAEAEAAAIAEADAALKKAEEVQKREAAKKANKANLAKKLGVHPENKQSTSDVSSEQSDEHSTQSEHSQACDSSGTDIVQGGQSEAEDASQTSVSQELKDEEAKQADPSCAEDTKTDVYNIGEIIVKEVLDEVISTDLFGQDDTQGTEATNDEHPDEDTSCSESLAAERSEHLQDTNDDLDEISVLEETSVSQFSEDPNVEENSIQEDCSQLSQTKSDSETRSTASTTHSEGSQSTKSDTDSQSMKSDTDSQSMKSDTDSQSMISDPDSQSMKSDPDSQSTKSDSDSKSTKSDPESKSTKSGSDSSSKLIELGGKKVPKKVLVSAASLVEEILSEMPEVLPNDAKSNASPKLARNGGPVKNNLEVKIPEAPNEAKPKRAEDNSEPGARRKRLEFKKSDSRIYEHVKRSLECAAPEILETAVGVLEEIEKVVIEKVGTRIS